jgi:hypothetical protein
VKLTVTVVLAITLLTSFTENTTLADGYAAVGVPETNPVLAFIVIPPGSVPELV